MSAAFLKYHLLQCWHSYNIWQSGIFSEVLFSFELSTQLKIRFKSLKETSGIEAAELFFNPRQRIKMKLKFGISPAYLSAPLVLLRNTSVT